MESLAAGDYSTGIGGRKQWSRAITVKKSRATEIAG